MALLGLWSFASPWLLLWGAAAVIPVLIHLWSRRRYFETPWAATQFLLAAIRRHQRRIQIEQWLLLALRALILLLLALALAEPVVSGLPGLSGRMRRPPTYTILVIDTSYSMATEHRGVSRLAETRSQAIKLVEDAAAGDAFSLVRLADPPMVIVGDPSASHAAVIDEINGVRVTNRGADLAATIEHVERLLLAAGEQYERNRVHIFSDLGKTNWSDKSRDRWQSRLTAISKRAALQVSHVGPKDTPENAAITNIELPSGVTSIGKPVPIKVTISNFSNRQQPRKRVELSVDGRQVDERFVDLEIGRQASIVFTTTFHVAGDHVVEASLGDDALRLDNKRWVAVPVRETTRVLCIQGRPHAAEYVALALQPDLESGELHAEVASEHAILERTLHEFDCIFLCNVARFTADEAARLRHYVEQGGCLVFVLGDLVQSQLYNEQLGSASQSKLLPAKLNEIVSDRRHTFNPLEYRHALTLPFRGHERSGLLTVPTWRYIRLDLIDDSATVALAFDNGDPAIIEAQLGQGRVLVVATAASPESLDRTTEPATPWNALASWPSFPPLVHEIVRFAASGRIAQRNVLVGDVLSARLPSRDSKTNATITTPSGDQVSLRLGEAERFWTYDVTEQPGVYVVAHGDETIPKQSFTVNIDTGSLNDSESILEPVDLDSLRGLLDTTVEPGNNNVQEGTGREAPLFRLALGGLLVLLVLESFLASRFGRATQ